MLIRHGATKPAPISKISTVFLVSIGILLVLLSGSMGFSASNDSPKTAEIKDSDFDPTENPTVMQDVAGTCMNKRSEPIVSAKVELWIIRRNYAVGSQAFKERETMSDQGGRFKFARVLVPTEYGSLVRCVVVRPQGYEASRVDIRAKQKHLKGFDPASLLFEFEPRDAAFSGKVIGPKGEPLVRIRVVNDYSQDPAMQVHEYQTDAEGKFRVPIVSRWFAEGRPWTVRRGVMRFVSPEFGVIATNYDHETPFTTIQFTGTGLVHGQVVDKSTGAPLANITVSSQDSSGSRDDFFCDAATTTDKLGRFTLRFPVSCLKNLFFKDPANKLLAPAMENQRIQIGKTYDLGRIEMTSGVLLSGQLIDLENGAKMTLRTGERARIGAHGPTNPRSSASIAGAEVKQDGTFELRLAPGTNWIYLSDRSSLESGFETSNGIQMMRLELSGSVKKVLLPVRRHNRRAEDADIITPNSKIPSKAKN